MSLKGVYWPIPFTDKKQHSTQRDLTPRSVGVMKPV